MGRLSRETSELDSGVVRWSVAPLIWQNGPIKTTNKGKVYCDPAQNYPLPGMELRDAFDVFKEFAGVGEGFRMLEISLYADPITGESMEIESLSPEADKALYAFMEKHGIPTDYSRDIPVVMSTIQYDIDIISNPYPIEDLATIKADAIAAAMCERLLRNVKGRSKAKIQATLTEYPFIIDHSQIIDREIPKNEDDIAIWRSYALDALWEISNLYAPSIGVRYERTKTGRQSVCVLNGLKTAMWLAFQMSLPGDDVYIDKRCLDTTRKDGSVYHGCGHLFSTTDSRARQCPECKRKNNAEKQRKKREKAKNSVI